MLGGVYNRLVSRARAAWRFFFPRKLTIPPQIQRQLEWIYPTIDWEHVQVYDGWPHLLSLSSYTAITLPDPHGIHWINIYFKKGRWQPDAAANLSVLVHEGYHVLQIREAASGYGAGLARPFIILYLACWAANGFAYEGHPLEEAAYHVAGRPGSLYEQFLHRHDGEDVLSLASQEFETADAQLVQTETACSFPRRLITCTPGLPTVRAVGGRVMPKFLVDSIGGIYGAVWMSFWTAMVLVLWLLFLAVEIVGILAAGIVWGTAGLAWMGAWIEKQLRRDMSEDW